MVDATPAASQPFLDAQPKSVVIGREDDLLAKARQHESFSPAERRVAEFLLAPAESDADAADCRYQATANVSQPTVICLCCTTAPFAGLSLQLVAVLTGTIPVTR